MIKNIILKNNEEKRLLVVYKFEIIQ